MTKKCKDCKTKVEDGILCDLCYQERYIEGSLKEQIKEVLKNE